MDIKQLLTDLGVTNLQGAQADYKRYTTGEPKPMSLTTDWDKIDWDGFFEMHKGKVELRGFYEYARYLGETKSLKQAYHKHKDWDKALNDCQCIDDFAFAEAFIDLIELTYDTAIKDAKHLKELTGCKDYAPGSKESLQGDIYNARWIKYDRALSYAIEQGAKYKDLLNMKPKDWGLPDKWTGNNLAANQHEAIVWAIGEAFYLGESSHYMPGLRIVAKELDAPYSVVMEAHKRLNV